jgi:WD40 repeat protein
VSGGFKDGKVATWNAASGERLDEAAAESGVVALAAIDSGRFVAGTKGGDVVFYTHHGGRGVEGAARIEGAHKGWIYDFALCGGRLATASDDKTAAVWGVDSRKRLARLSEHALAVESVDMNGRLVVTGSWDETVRVHDAERGYYCTAVLDWVHTYLVNSVTTVGDDHILSGAYDHTVCVTQVSSRRVVTRIKLRSPIRRRSARRPPRGVRRQ